MTDKQRGTEGERELEERQNEATSSETLNDVKREEKSSDSRQDSSVPAPDGSPDPDSRGGRADGSDTGGPM